MSKISLINRLKLGELQCGERAIILLIAAPDEKLARRLMEMGLLEGAEAELVHEAPLGGDPIAVRVRGTMLALRRAEANWIEVEKC